MSTKGAHSGMSGACDSKRPMSARPMKMASIQHVSMAAKRKGRSISPRLGVCANSVVRIDKRCCLRLLAAFARGISWLSALSCGCFGGKFIPGSDACSHLLYCYNRIKLYDCYVLLYTDLYPFFTLWYMF